MKGAGNRYRRHKGQASPGLILSPEEASNLQDSCLSWFAMTWAMGTALPRDFFLSTENHRRGAWAPANGNLELGSKAASFSVVLHQLCDSSSSLLHFSVPVSFHKWGCYCLTWRAAADMEWNRVLKTELGTYVHSPPLCSSLHFLLEGSGISVFILLNSKTSGGFWRQVLSPAAETLRPGSQLSGRGPGLRVCLFPLLALYLGLAAGSHWALLLPSVRWVNLCTMRFPGFPGIVPII